MGHFITRLSKLINQLSRVLAIALLSVVPALASSVLTIDGGTLTASRLLNLDTGNFLFNLRGNVTFGVTNGTPQGFVILTYSTGGTDPGLATLAFGNSLLYGFAPEPKEMLIAFDVTTPLLTPSTLGLLSGVGTSVSPNPVTDPASRALLGPTQFSFGLTNISLPDTEDQVLVTYDLTGATTTSQIPEPGKAWLLALAFGVLAIFRAVCRAVHV